MSRWMDESNMMTWQIFEWHQMGRSSDHDAKTKTQFRAPVVLFIYQAFMTFSGREERCKKRRNLEGEPIRLLFTF